MSTEPIKAPKRKTAIYRIYENGEKELIARVTSSLDAIEIAARHYGDGGERRTGILIRSESEEADADDGCT